MANRSATEYQSVRDIYEEAFRRWSNALRSGDNTIEAERLYRQCRDTLAGIILEPDAGRPSAVQRLAHSLWERAGRPAGTAESDWYRAEALVSSLSPYGCRLETLSFAKIAGTTKFIGDSGLPPPSAPVGAGAALVTTLQISNPS